MTPRLHFPGAGLGQGGEFTPEQARRLFRVLRMRPGDSVILFDGRGNEFAAEIESLGPDSGAARIVSQLPQPAADADIRARIGQALCAPNKMDWAVEKMTELGATQITPLLTAKTAPTKFSVARANRLAIAACEQCGRAHAPDIREAERLSDFLSHSFPDARKILLSPKADDSLAEVFGGGERRRLGGCLFVRPRVRFHIGGGGANKVGGICVGAFGAAHFAARKRRR